jgi:succinyl-diaminopimelate desuccinylase
VNNFLRVIKVCVYLYVFNKKLLEIFTFKDLMVMIKVVLFDWRVNMGNSLAVNLTKDLVKIESSNPGTHESCVESFLHQYFLTLPDVIITREEVLPGRFNLMAELSDQKEDESALVFICHMDTVVAGSGWGVLPFGAIEKDGMIYGRGSCDMKSGLACCLSAFSYAALQREKTGNPLKRPLRMICSVDEEGLMRGVEACIRSGWITKRDWVLDAEPTNSQIQVAHKGRVWYEIEVNGHTAHASTPWKGADAIAAMAEIICDIRKAVEGTTEHLDLGKSTVTFGQITGGYQPYVVPDFCKVWIDMRLVPPYDYMWSNSVIESALLEAERRVTGIKAAYTVTGNRSYVEKDDSSPLLNQLKQSCLAVTGRSPVVGCFTGYTDTAVAASTLHNCNCMSYGPGNLECAHQPDEYVTVADILRCELVYKQLVNDIILNEKR